MALGHKAVLENYLVPQVEAIEKQIDKQLLNHNTSWDEKCNTVEIRIVTDVYPFILEQAIQRYYDAGWEDAYYKEITSEGRRAYIIHLMNKSLSVDASDLTAKWSPMGFNYTHAVNVKHTAPKGGYFDR